MMQKQFTKEHSLVVKGLAILLLLMYHLFENEQLVNSMEVNYSPFPLSGFLMFTGFGNICVAIFVFLTTFGIATGLFAQEELSPKQAYNQAVRRFFVLAANFAVLFFSVNLLWFYKFDYASLYGSGKQGILYALTDAFGLSMFIDTPTLNMTWWYMELAYILIFLVPFLVWLVKKIGYPVLMLAFIVPTIVNLNVDVERYLFVAVFGVCAAYGKWPDKLLNLKLHPVFQWIIGIMGFVLCVLVRQNFVVHEYYVHLVEAPIALFFIFFGGRLLGSVPVLKNVLGFIGKYSMNIYLVHTFFYMALWQKFIYQFKYAVITVLLLLGVTLLYSVLLELLKKVVGFKKLMVRLHGSYLK